MPARAQKALGLGVELLDGDAPERGEDAGRERRQVGVVARVVLGEDRAQPAVVVLVCGLPGLAGAKLGIGLRHLDQPAEDEVGLDRQRLLAPQRAVVVKHRHPLLDGHVVRYDLLDEVHHRLPCSAGAPAGQRLGLAPHQDLLLGNNP